MASRCSPRSAARPRQCCALCNGRAAPPVLSVPAALRPSALPALIQPRSPTPPPAPVVGPRAGQRPEGVGAAGPGGAGAGARAFRIARPPLRPPAPRPPACRCQQGAMGATNPITPLSKAAFFFPFFFFSTLFSPLLLNTVRVLFIRRVCVSTIKLHQLSPVFSVFRFSVSVLPKVSVLLAPILSRICVIWRL